MPLGIAEGPEEVPSVAFGDAIASRAANNIAPAIDWKLGRGKAWKPFCSSARHKIVIVADTILIFILCAYLIVLDDWEFCIVSKWRGLPVPGPPCSGPTISLLSSPCCFSTQQGLSPKLPS